MRTRLKSEPRAGDLAYVPNAGFEGTIPLFRIDRIEYDTDGKISAYYVAERGTGSRVEAASVTAVFANILEQQE